MLLLGIASGLAAQQPMPGVIPATAACARDATAGSPAQNTLDILGLAGETGSARPGPGCHRSHWTAPLVGLWMNSSSSMNDRDGAVWQGRGITASLTAGVLLRFPVIELSLRPLAFAAQNAAFRPVGPVGGEHTGFRDPFWGGSIDKPVRFGDKLYARVAPGESWLRIGTRHVGVGASTASMRWGPATRFPLVMGTEAEGIPRLFSELRAVPIWLGRFDASWMVGRLESSPHFGLPAGNRSRMLTAATGVFTPAWGGGAIRLGANRVFHVRWNDQSVNARNAMLPFRGLLKRGNPTGETFQIGDWNQLASVFAAVAPSGAGIEVYGEFYREDHNYDARDLALEPDHLSAFTLGIRRAWRTAGSVHAITIETLNSRISHLVRVRPQGPPYLHAEISEGHTYLGQVLGSSAAIGGGGLFASYACIGEESTTAIDAEIRRTAQDSEGGTYNGQLGARYAVRLSRTRVRRSGVVGWSVGIDRGIGLDHGVNATLSVTLGDLWSESRGR